MWMAAIAIVMVMLGVVDAVLPRRLSVSDGSSRRVTAATIGIAKSRVGGAIAIVLGVWVHVGRLGMCSGHRGAGETRYGDVRGGGALALEGRV